MFWQQWLDGLTHTSDKRAPQMWAVRLLFGFPCEPPPNEGPSKKTDPHRFQPRPPRIEWPSSKSGRSALEDGLRHLRANGHIPSANCWLLGQISSPSRESVLVCQNDPHSTKGYRLRREPGFPWKAHAQQVAWIKKTPSQTSLFVCFFVHHL